MIQKAEIYARQFYQELKSEFWGKQNFISKFLGTKSNEPKSEITITLNEAGTQSNCTIIKESRLCSVNCFDIDWMNLSHKGPEFYTTYIEKGKSIANGRTFNKLETIESIRNWLQNETLEELYSKFSFIDAKKRQLEKLRTDINNSNPNLSTISKNTVAIESFSSYSLWFKDDNRSCRIYYYGYEPNPRYIFKWDDCAILETSGSDIERLGTLVNKWIFDKAMPSALKKEFPELAFDKLAKYYEKGNGIEGEFILSWDDIENFYQELEHENKREILKLIKQMREYGFDKTLRAGQSLYTMIISRSRRHGLRDNQNSISCSFDYIKSRMEVRTRQGEKFEFSKIEYNDTIDKLLRAIELEEID